MKPILKLTSAIAMSIMMVVALIPCLSYADDSTKDIAYANISGVADQFYSGGIGMPQETTIDSYMEDVYVELDGEALVYKTDFTVEFQDNTNIGTAKAIFKGIGNYTGTKIVNYEITKQPQGVEASFSSKTINVGGTATLTLNKGTEVSGINIGEITATAGNGKIRVQSLGATDKNYKFQIYGEKAGKGIVTVNCAGDDYYDAVTKSYYVTVQNSTLASKNVTLSKSSYSYTGSAIKPGVTVKVNGKKLKKGTDYSVSYSNNVNVGTGTVKVKGKGTYSGTVQKNFKITKGKQVISVNVTTTKLSPSGTARITQTPAHKNVNIGVFSYSSSNQSVIKVTRDKSHNCTVTAVGTGTAKVTIKAAGTSNLNSATRTITFTVKSSGTKVLKSSMIKVNPKSFKYDGKQHYPDITAYYNGQKLKYGTEWKYWIPGKGIKKGTYEIKVWGVGNYTGSFTMYYTIK